MESVSGRERAGSVRPEFMLCHCSDLYADRAPAPQSLQAALIEAAPLSPSSSLFLLFLLQFLRSFPHQSGFSFCTRAIMPVPKCPPVPGLPDLPGPAAKANLGEALSLKSKSTEERI